MAAAMVISERVLQDIGPWLIAGKVKATFNQEAYAQGGVPFPNGLEIDLGVQELLISEPAFDDATNTIVGTIVPSTGYVILWDINAGIQKANGVLPAGLVLVLRYIGRRRG